MLIEEPLQNRSFFFVLRLSNNSTVLSLLNLNTKKKLRFWAIITQPQYKKEAPVVERFFDQYICYGRHDSKQLPPLVYAALSYWCVRP